MRYYTRKLKLTCSSGNRFSIEPEDFGDATPEEYFSGVEELGIDETLFSWPETCTLLTMFHDLKRLEASKNNYTTLPHSHSLSRYGISPFLLEVKLEYNNFTSFTDILPLSATSSLQSLLLKGNNILKLSAGSGDELPRFGQKLDFVDLSYNQISDWSFIEALPSVFPGLTSLRISHNPVFEIPWTIGGEVQAKVVDEDHMITIARLPKLTTLNFSKITEADRTNAEIFYLSRIARELAALKPEEEAGIIAKHPRYVELCEIHGEPAVPRKKEVMNPNFLEARLIEFTFYMPASTMVSQTEVIEKKRELPKGLDAYRLKGVVGRLFGVRPLRLQLIWETGEWDPVAGFEEKEDDSDDEGVVTEVKANGGGSDERGKYMERLVELEDGTRAIGNIIDGREAKVRVEVIEDTQG